MTNGSFNPVEYCRESVRKYDHENYLCTGLLKDPARTAVTSIRAFNIEVAHIRCDRATRSVCELHLVE